MYAGRVASHAAPWRVTVSMPRGQTNGRTPDRYITLPAIIVANFLLRLRSQWGYLFRGARSVTETGDLIYPRPTVRQANTVVGKTVGWRRNGAAV